MLPKTRELERRPHFEVAKIACSAGGEEKAPSAPRKAEETVGYTKD